ncbi:MAG TPA: glycerophosphodiester phosphodiesterase [Gaiellaceae bacterium]|nr:glycerophosphodiester phosphodiesterase [Gaiellaceae bacterium]
MLELLRGERDVVRVGHRGAAALAPENSLAAVEAAAALGVDAVELDVMGRPDGELVLAHGPELPPDSPRLDDALALAAAHGLAVQLDVKLPGLESGIVASLHRHDLFARSFVSSFSPAVLGAFAEVAPELPRSFTYPEDRLRVSERRLLRPLLAPGLGVLRALLPRRLPQWLRTVDASAATLNTGVVTAAAVTVCHRLGAAVYVWTVNEPALVRTLLETGVDGIITDDPRVLVPAS